MGYLEQALFDVGIHNVDNFMLLRGESKAICMGLKGSHSFFSTYERSHSEISHSRDALIPHFHLHKKRYFTLDKSKACKTLIRTNFSWATRSASSAAFAACCRYRFRSSWIMRYAVASRRDSLLRYNISLMKIEHFPCCSIARAVAGATSFPRDWPGAKKLRRRYLKNHCFFLVLPSKAPILCAEARSGSGWTAFFIMLI